MRYEKADAVKLRLQGYSYSEIKKKTGVPKSTLSGWLHDVQISERARRRIKKRVFEGSKKGLLKKNKKQTHEAHRRAKGNRSAGKKNVKVLSEQELLLVGAALYWAEGYKRPIVYKGRQRTYHPVSLSNSDPFLVRVFMRFLREICGVTQNRMIAEIRIFEYINEDEAVRYWMKQTDLPVQNFRKCYYGISKFSESKRPYKRLPYGTVQIRVNDTNLFHRIMGMIEGLSASG